MSDSATSPANNEEACVGDYQVRQRRVPKPRGLAAVEEHRLKKAAELQQQQQQQQDDPRPPHHSRRLIWHSIIVQVFIAAILSGFTLVIVSYVLGLWHISTWATDTNLFHADTKQDHTVLEQLNTTGKPFVIAFYSTQCIACRRMQKPFTLATKQLTSMIQCFAANVAEDNNEHLLMTYNVTSVPAIYYVHGIRRVHYQGKADETPIVDFVKKELGQTI